MTRGFLNVSSTVSPNSAPLSSRISGKSYFSTLIQLFCKTWTIFLRGRQFNSGVMVLEPARELFGRLVEALAVAQTYDGGDQGFLNSFWPDWWAMPAEHRLSPAYNMPHFNFQFMHAHPGLNRRFLNETKIVHYTLQKPWLNFMLTGGSNTWWQKFFSAHPEKHSEWRQGLHTIQDWSFENVVAILGGD
jgi:hypothetical protein